MKTKLCTKCETEKPIDAFNNTQRWCKPCIKHYDHLRHKSQAVKIRAQKKIRKQGLRQWIIKLKSTLKCNRCPETHYACLTFHHTDPNKKDIEISNAVKSGWGKERILIEIDKCEVLCANCHLKHHYSESSLEYSHL